MSAVQSDGSPEGVAEFMSAEDKAASLLRARNAHRYRTRPVLEPVVLLTKAQAVLAAESFSQDPLCRKDELSQVEAVSEIMPNMGEAERVIVAVLDADGCLTLDCEVLEKVIALEKSLSETGGSRAELQERLRATGVLGTPIGRNAEQLIATQNATAYYIAIKKCAGPGLADIREELRALSMGVCPWIDGRGAILGLDSVHNSLKEEHRQRLLTLGAQKLNWEYSSSVLYTARDMVKLYRRAANEAFIHGEVSTINVALKLASEIESVPDECQDSTCVNRARHFLQALAESLRALGDKGIPTDSAVREVLSSFEKVAGHAGQPKTKPLGASLLPSDREKSEALQAELGRLRREVAHSSKPAPKPKPVKAAAACVDVVPGSKPCPVCHVEGHRSAECPSKLFVPGTDGVVLKTFKCWNCDKHGHRRNDCPSAKEKPKGTDLASAAGVVPPAADSTTNTPAVPLNGLTSSATPSAVGVKQP